MSGTLYVVATPLGNLRDLSPRALEVLGGVSLILCEDTRRTVQLLHAHGLDTPLMSCHEHNERERAGRVADLLQAGQDVALVSDAGTPLVSDPGRPVLQACADRGLPVVPVPGPCAVTTLLSVSHLPADRFAFIGFPPPRAAQRVRFLRAWAGLPVDVLALYEAPHRVVALLGDLETVFGDVEAVVEEILRGRLSGIRDRLAARDRVRGEFTLLVAAGGGETRVPAGTTDPGDWRSRLAELERSGLPRAQALRSLSAETGIPRNRLYRLLLESADGPADE